MLDRLDRMPMKITTLRLTERLWTLLEAEAREEGTSASQLIREGAMMRLGYALGKQGREEVAPTGSPVFRAAEPFPDFGSAAGGVLDFLHERLGFALWLVTRVEDGRWVIEHARDEGYGVEVGDAFPFADTHCAQMVEGLGPHFAPETNTVPCYAAAGLPTSFPLPPTSAFRCSTSMAPCLERCALSTRRLNLRASATSFRWLI